MTRAVLKLPPALAPAQVAVCSLTPKVCLVKAAVKIFHGLRFVFAKG